MMKDYKIVSLDYALCDELSYYKVGRNGVKSIVLESETETFLRYVVAFDDGHECVIEGINILTHRVPLAEREKETPNA